MNDKPIPLKNVCNFLGFNHNFNNHNFVLYHFKNKLSKFEKLLHSLYLNGTIGGDLSIDIQMKLYKKK